MNDSFVSIKVDREEHPDIDEQLMLFVTATNEGHGGWPLSVFLTSELVPFFGGTYWSQEQLQTLLRLIAQKWATNAGEIQTSSKAIAEALSKSVSSTRNTMTSVSALSALSLSSLLGRIDGEYGGLGRETKFPQPCHLLLILSQLPARDEMPLPMAKTLLAMCHGALYDHLGGGFHRYCVDRQWRVPHFEKMLYDQAQLLSVYSRALDCMTDEKNLQTWHHIIDGVVAYLDQIRDPYNGAFYSAEDADSGPQHAEGAFYVWGHDEVMQVLGPTDGASFCESFNVLPKGNVPSELDPHGELTGMNVLQRVLPQRENDNELLSRLRRHRDETRPRPHCDRKVLTSWNAMTVSALCQTFYATGTDLHLSLARDCFGFIQHNMLTCNTHGVKCVLQRSFFEGQPAAGITAQPDDYANVIDAAINLYEATLDSEYLTLAHALQKEMDQRFWDDERNGYCTSKLFVSLVTVQDGAERNANGLAASNLFRLYNDTEYAESKMGQINKIMSNCPSIEACPTLAEAISRYGRQNPVMLTIPPSWTPFQIRHSVRRAAVLVNSRRNTSKTNSTKEDSSMDGAERHCGWGQFGYIVRAATADSSSMQVCFDNACHLFNQ